METSEWRTYCNKINNILYESFYVYWLPSLAPSGRSLGLLLTSFTSYPYHAGTLNRLPEDSISSINSGNKLTGLLGLSFQLTLLSPRFPILLQKGLTFYSYIIRLTFSSYMIWFILLVPIGGPPTIR